MKVCPFNLGSCNEAATSVIPVPDVVLIVLLWDVCVRSCVLLSLFFWGPWGVYNVMAEHICMFTCSNVGSCFFLWLLKHWRWSHFCVIYLPTMNSNSLLAAQSFEVILCYAVWDPQLFKSSFVLRLALCDWKLRKINEYYLASDSDSYWLLVADVKFVV